MNKLVKILVDDDGYKNDDPEWCIDMSFIMGYSSPRTLCTGEVYGDGESAAIFKVKLNKRGGVTCPNCLRIIKGFKKVKL